MKYVSVYDICIWYEIYIGIWYMYMYVMHVCM